jgi:hypothetical protein
MTVSHGKGEYARGPIHVNIAESWNALGPGPTSNARTHEAIAFSQKARGSCIRSQSANRGSGSNVRELFRALRQVFRYLGIFFAHMLVWAVVALVGTYIAFGLLEPHMAAIRSTTASLFPQLREYYVTLVAASIVTFAALVPAFAVGLFLFRYFKIPDVPGDKI